MIFLLRYPKLLTIAHQAVRLQEDYCSSQGKAQVFDYAIEFCTLAADSCWNNHALCVAFLRGLSEEIKGYLGPLDIPTDLTSLISEGGNILNGQCTSSRGQHGSMEATKESTSVTASTSAFPSMLEEPVQLGGARLSPEKRQHQVKEGRCIYCGQLVVL